MREPETNKTSLIVLIQLVYDDTLLETSLTKPADFTLWVGLTTLLTVVWLYWTYVASPQKVLEGFGKARDEMTAAEFKR